MKRLLKGGRVIDPVNGLDGVQDILFDGDRIAAVGRDLASLGMGSVDLAHVDALLGEYLMGGDGKGSDQVPGALAAGLVAAFDRLWFEVSADTLV